MFFNWLSHLIWKHTFTWKNNSWDVQMGNCDRPLRIKLKYKSSFFYFSKNWMLNYLCWNFPDKFGFLLGTNHRKEALIFFMNLREMQKTVLTLQILLKSPWWRFEACTENWNVFWVMWRNRNILSQSEKLDNVCFITIKTSFTKV